MPSRWHIHIFFFWNVFSEPLNPAYHVDCMCCVCRHIQTSEKYPQVWKLDGGIIRMYPSYTLIYHSIPSYDGIWRYMSGYQVGRIPDENRADLTTPANIFMCLEETAASNACSAAGNSLSSFLWSRLDWLSLDESCNLNLTQFNWIERMGRLVVHRLKDPDWQTFHGNILKWWSFHSVEFLSLDLAFCGLGFNFHLRTFIGPIDFIR